MASVKIAACFILLIIDVVSSYLNEKLALRKESGSIVRQMDGFEYIKEPFYKQSVKNLVSCCLRCDIDSNCQSCNFVTGSDSKLCLLFNTKPTNELATEHELQRKEDSVHVEMMTTPELWDMDAIESLPKSYNSISRVKFDDKKQYFSYDTQTPGGGWLVIQRRFDGSVDFNRNWQEYKEGFGSVDGEFWFGLEKIHQITKSNDIILRVDVLDFSNRFYAEYDGFFITDEADGYRLTHGSYSGDAGDSLVISRNRKFTTMDRDHDGWPGNCAIKYQSGWWANNCFRANGNGLYLNGTVAGHGFGILWSTLKGFYYSLPGFEMKIRKK